MNRFLRLQEKDHFHWTKPNLGIFTYKGRKTNIVAFGHVGSGVFKNPHAQDPNKKYKIFGALKHRHPYVQYSKNGLHGEKKDQPGVVRTEPLETRGNSLWVTADVNEGGAVKVAVFYEGEKVGETGLIADAAVVGVMDVSKYRGESLTLEFIVDGGKVYSFGFDG
jgi:hypothetical protein